MTNLYQKYKKYKKYIIFSLLTVNLTLLSGCTYFTEQAIEEAFSKEASIANYPAGLNVFLCGTGTPYPDEARNPSCLAIVAGSEYLVFDSGEGSSRRLDTMGLPTKELDAVFISHWHSDHFSGLGYLINSSWVFGRDQTLEVYGPKGVENVIEGIKQTYSQDIFYRSGLQADKLEKEYAVALAKPILLADGNTKSLLVYNKNGVKVSAFLVDHAPVKPALGYMVEYKGRKVVISGDTRITDTVERYAKNADILFHEALNIEMNQSAIKVAKKLGLHARASQIEAIIPYHASTIDIAKLAQRANVEKLVLTHFIPGPPNWIAEQVFMDGMDEHFDGEIISGEDKMHINLPVKEY